MSNKLLIVESPAKAKTIGKYLGGEFTVKSSVGHIRDLPKKGLSIKIAPEAGKETPSQASVPTEPEAAQSLLGPMGSLALGENQASAVILSQNALGLRFLPRAQFPFAECSS